MANNSTSVKDKATALVDKVKTYWKTPMPNRYMTFREIAAYSGGGIGAYMIITLGTACLLATGNVLISSALGVGATDMYIMYVIAVLANIPLTGIRANIIDNTRNKEGKYRPYIVTMAIPTAIICVLMVWFPYSWLETVFTGTLFGKSTAYVVKCAIIMVLNLFLHFFYYFFYDAYENLIHVLSPNSQERADVSSVKSIVYSFAPTVVNLFTPIIAQHIFHTNTTDIRVYRLLYPILGVIGILLCIVVYKYTEEKIVQARTHVIQIRLIDALREVAKNKYFWIISLASWIGFLESSYANILAWLYNYGGACSGTVYGLLITIYGNSSLWGMLLAPFCIRRWGKKKVLVVTNIFNIVFILMMYPFTQSIQVTTIWLVMGCLYLNGFMGAFMHILNPAIQADIRDYQQYRTGERIDGMFSAVNTIGTVIALATSSVLPIIYEKGGITEAGAKAVTSNPNVLSRMLGDGQTVGQILEAQLANGQNNYINPYSALYDPNILLSLLHVLIIVSAIGALMNVIPYAWYDFTEQKQKSIVRVLKVRAMFEDYGNGIIDNGTLVEAIDIIREARANAEKEIKEVKKSDYKKENYANDKKAAKKAYKEALEANDEIAIAKFVCEELDKFSTDLYIHELEVSKDIYLGGIDAIRNKERSELKKQLKNAKAMPKKTAEEKALRKFEIELARTSFTSWKAAKEYYKPGEEMVAPDFAVLEGYFDEEDKCDEKLKELYQARRDAVKAKDKAEASRIKAEIKAVSDKRSSVRKDSKTEMDRHAYFNRAAKVYLDAEKLIKQAENYERFDEIAEKYDEAKENHEKALEELAAEAARVAAEEKEEAKRIKAEKALAKAEKKNRKNKDEKEKSKKNKTTSSKK
ncbi:MAG: MFS transporter [Acutalibacteraceae bacterium]